MESGKMTELLGLVRAPKLPIVPVYILAVASMTENISWNATNTGLVIKEWNGNTTFNSTLLERVILTPGPMMRLSVVQVTIL
jgi:hypothetical protein